MSMEIAYAGMVARLQHFRRKGRPLQAETHILDNYGLSVLPLAVLQ